MSGIVYLIHFARPIGNLGSSYGRAQHYIGWTPGTLEARLEVHRSGNGARIMAAVTAAGIDWQVTRTWEGGRDFERELKRAKSTPRLCFACSPGNRRRAVPRVGGERPVRATAQADLDDSATPGTQR